jgi:hypothetical protein
MYLRFQLPLNHEAKIALNYTHALHLDRQLEALDTRVQQALVLLDTIKESTMRAWSLSPAQQVSEPLNLFCSSLIMVP